MLQEDTESSHFLVTEKKAEVELPDPFKVRFDKVSWVGLTDATKRRGTRRLNKAKGSGDSKSKKVEEEAIDGYNVFDVVSPPYNMDYLAKLYELDSTNYAAINAKVANVVGLGWDLKPSPKAIDRISELEGNDENVKKFRKKMDRAYRGVKSMLDSINDEETFTEVLIRIVVDYEATGNAFLEIGRTSEGSIGYIGHIPSKTVRVRRQRDGFVQIVGRQVVFFRNYGDKETTNPLGKDENPNEIIHFKKYTPTSSYYGIPDIITAINAVLGQRFATQYNIDYFENKAVPRYAVIIKGAKVSTQLQEDIFSFFSNNLKGQNHRSIIVPLPADTSEAKTSFEMKPIEAGIQDSSFNQYRKSNVSEILSAHRVPPTKVSIAEGASLAVARDADKTFKEQVCRPIQNKIEKKVNALFAEFTDMHVFKLNELALTDEDTQSKIDERYVRLKVIVPNEIRSRMGLPAIEGGDKPVELSAQRQAETRTQASGNRGRDQARSAAAPDSDGEARNPKGEGRQTA